MNAQRPRQSGAATDADRHDTGAGRRAMDARVTPKNRRAACAVVDGCMMHPEYVAVCADLIRPGDLGDIDLIIIWRALLNAHDAGEIDPDVLGSAYVATGRRLADAGRWAARVYAPGRDLTAEDWADPVTAAQVLAMARRRREIAAELVRAGEAVAAGSDPDAVLARLGVAA